MIILPYIRPDLLIKDWEKMKRIHILLAVLLLLPMLFSCGSGTAEPMEEAVPAKDAPVLVKEGAVVYSVIRSTESDQKLTDQVTEFCRSVRCFSAGCRQLSGNVSYHAAPDSDEAEKGRIQL